jgi:YidC/Oxa1 family membrane protein insertase
MRATALFLSSPLDIFKPIHDLWHAVFFTSLDWLLHAIYAQVQGIPLIATIGAYGVAIIVITLIIRALLAPLLQFQLVTSRRAMVEQRKLAPQVAELKKKYKKDPQRLNAETMKLYQEHGINPLGQFVGCLPMVLQMPVLIALYYVFTTFAHTSHAAAHFLFVPNLNQNPNAHVLFSGIPIPSDPVYLIFPLLAALTTYVQSKMMQMPPPPNPTEQELQTMQMQRTMVLISPLMIGYFALNVPAGLGLYWFVGNLVSIIQQSFVVGWGNALPKWMKPGSAAVVAPPPNKSSANGQKAGTALPPSSAKKAKNRAPNQGAKSQGKET